MKHKNLALTLGVVILSTFILLVSCKKINDYTTLGGDLIPAVDGINTFETILDVWTYNDTFSAVNDTILYNANSNFFLGHLEDPLFGKTDAIISFELKPSLYKFTFNGRPDSLHIDSVVLVLDYTQTYGDTNAVQTVNVYEIGNQFDYDSTYNIRQYSQTRAGLLGSRSFQPRVLNDSIKVYADTSANQLRIRLNDSFGARLLGYDTSTVHGRQDAYSSYSLFTSKFRGFTLESTSGSALMGFNLLGTNSRLAIYYKDDNGDVTGTIPTPNWDTAVAYFSFAGNSTSAAAQYIKRDFAGTQLAALSNGNTGTPDNEVYIQSAPGSYATLKIPGLDTLSNCVVHRAEIIMEQIWSGLSDSIYSPVNMYVDAWDPQLSSYRTIPYDVVFDQSGSVNLSTFGVVPYSAPDPFGNAIKQWRFNVTRYVQNVVNSNVPVYDLRLSMPFYVTEKFKLTPASTAVQVDIPVNNTVGVGRVRLHGYADGTQAGANPQRMRMRVVYSKI